MSALVKAAKSRRSAMTISDKDAARFWAKVDKSNADGCWTWLGYLNRGYGNFTINGKCLRAHRVACSLVGKPIAPHLVTDHLCRNRSCVNPAHLEGVTVRENTIRGIAPEKTRARFSAATHCSNGHPLSGDNLKTDGRGRRICAACRRVRDMEQSRRARGCPLVGPSTRRQKIDRTECLALRREGWSYSQLAERYAVNQSSIGKVCTARAKKEGRRPVSALPLTQENSRGR